MYYVFWGTRGEDTAACYVTNDLGNTDEGLNNVDTVYYCDDKDDLDDCGKGKWDVYDSSTGQYEEDMLLEKIKKNQRKRY